MPQIFKEKEQELKALCQQHHVQKLYAFGSSVKGNFHDTRDIDLMVIIDEPDPVQKGDLLLDFYMALQDLFERKVDLLSDQTIENPYLKKSVDDSKILIYDREGKELLV